MGIVMAIVFIWLSFNALFIVVLTLAYWHHCQNDHASPLQPCDKPEHPPPYRHAYRHHTQPHHATTQQPQPPDTDSLL